MCRAGPKRRPAKDPLMRFAIISIALLTFTLPAMAQDRVVPKSAKGGTGFGEPWARVPAEYKALRIPDWPVPTDVKKWQNDRVKVRQTLLKCLGDMPARPDPSKVMPTFKEE